MAQQPGQQYGAGGEQFGQQGQQSQQFGQQQGPGGGQQGMDIKLEEGLTEEMRVVLHDLVQSATACEWCAERCIDEGPQMAECLRLCRDVADLATLNVQLLARDSVFGPEAIEVFASAAEACAQECARHGHRHCQECAEQLSRAVQSTRKMLASFGQQGGQSQPIQQTGGQQFGGAPDQQSQQPMGGGGQIQGSQGMQPSQGQSFGQSGGQQPGQQGQSGQHYAEGQPSQGQSGQQF